MTDLHPITPPPELVEQWDGHGKSRSDAAQTLATKAAQWGADQELEACCKWLVRERPDTGSMCSHLREGRRPKPPSLKEQALARLTSLEKLVEAMGHCPDDTIRRALEALPND